MDEKLLLFSLTVERRGSVPPPEPLKVRLQLVGDSDACALLVVDV